MKLIFNAFLIYCLGLYSELCSLIFNRRVNRRLSQNAELTDKLTVSLSNLCWHYKLKFKMAEAEFEAKQRKSFC